MDSTLPLRRKGATTVLKLGGSSAVGASRGKRRRRESRRRGGSGAWGGGVPLLTGGGVWGGGRAPSPRKVFDFLSENGEFWCILGGASALYVYTAQESEAEEEGRERALVKDDILH